MRQVSIALDVWLGDIHLGRAFLDPREAWRPVSLGQIGDLIVSVDGVLPIHAWFGARGGAVYVASADASSPVLLFEQPVAARWTPLPVPCCLRLGKSIVKVSRLSVLRRPVEHRPTLPPLSGSDYVDEEPTLRRAAERK